MTAIFLSYRRSDTGFATTIIHQHLSKSFKDASVFIDVEGTLKGRDFRSQIDQALESCDVALAIIGDKWLTSFQEDTDADDNEIDYVLTELETATRRDIPIIPVLIEDATMPSQAALPIELTDFSYRNASRIRSGKDFTKDVQALVNDISQTLNAEGVAVETSELTDSDSALANTKLRETKVLWIVSCLLAVVAAGLALKLFLLPDEESYESQPPFRVLDPQSDKTPVWVEGPNGVSTDWVFKLDETPIVNLKGSLDLMAPGHKGDGDGLARAFSVLNLEKHEQPGLLSLTGEVVLPSGKRRLVSASKELSEYNSDISLLITIHEDGLVTLGSLAVCPWLYIEASRGLWERRVEIIQNLNHKALEGTQRVNVGRITPIEDGVVRVEVREELDEISYLDQLVLEVGDASTVRPSALTPSLQLVDNDYILLKKDELIRVEFRDPSLREGLPFDASIVATGYYEPKPE